MTAANCDATDRPIYRTVVVGTGYTGRRVLAALDNGIGVSRRSSAELADKPFFVRNLDSATIEPVTLPEPYAVLYTVPPDPDTAPDPRISRLLRSLSPVPRRVVYLSTSGVYGDRQGRLTGENVLPAPASGRARRRLEAEKRLLHYCGNTTCDAVILRVPGIYGPRRLGLQRIEAGTAVLREEDANPGNRIHVDDLARCCIAALQPDVPAGVYNVGDGDFRSSTWFSARIARMSGLAPPQQISRERAKQTFSARRMSFLCESRRLDTRKMREVLGVTPLYQNPEDGIRASLAEDGLLVR